jgi:hypothetical protein
MGSIEMILKTVLIGIGATLIVDLWGIILSLFSIKSLDYRFVGRWIAHFPEGKFVHKDIMKTAPARGELIIGWIVHYFIGIAFAFLLLLIYGKAWLEKPNLYHALIIGVITLIAPLFIMQPAFGFGIASSQLPKPNIRRLKSMATHLVYGIGLFITAYVLHKYW